MISLLATSSSNSKDKKTQNESEFKLSLSPLQQQKINFIKSLFSLYTRRIYIVGGFLRDQVLGIYSDDIDIEVYDVSPDIFEELMNKIDSKILSKQFYVYNYDGVDIALPRVEQKCGSGYHGFKIKITDNEKEATKRRDFTINSLMYNIYDDTLLDIWGGVDDMKNRILKIVNYETFSEDSLRLLRAIRFKSTYNLTIESKSKEILKSMDIDELSKSRINKELQKILV